MQGEVRHILCPAATLDGELLPQDRSALLCRRGDGFGKLQPIFLKTRAGWHREMKEPELQDPMAKATAIQDAPARDHLRADEIGPAFDGLSRDDKLKLYAVEAILRRGTGFGEGDLLRETICRALEGDRKCPRDITFMAFLVMTMKSIASHARDKCRRTVVAADPPEPVCADRPDAVIAPSPEDELIATSVLREIHRQFEDDEEATLVLMGWAEGLRGKELREATGLDQADLDYTIKRIRARARKLYPDGWMT